MARRSAPHVNEHGSATALRRLPVSTPPKAGANGAESAIAVLQRLAGNRAVAGLLPTHEHVSLAGDPVRLQRQSAGVAPDPVAETAPAPAAAGGSLDNEGNAVSTVGGRQFLTAIPGDVPWHRGKPQALPPNPKATYAQLRTRCVAVRDEQLAMADSMRGDMKYWFAKVYYFVTKNELANIDGHSYQYPLMKMQEVIAFQATYAQNLQNWRNSNIARVEGNWREAFAAAESSPGWYKTRALEIAAALLPSMQAHIRFDLPRAIASCFETSYAGVPGLSLADFHADFEAMGPVFDAAQANLQPEIDEAATWISPAVRVDPTNWHWAQSLGFPLIFNTAMERDHTWDKANDIVTGHQRGIRDQRAMDNRLRAHGTGRHPFSGEDDFQVDGEEITDYDWSRQPR